MFDTYLGSTTGVHRLRDGEITPLGLDSERVSALHAWREDGATTILAGSYGNGLFRSEDDGVSWASVEGVTAPAIRCVGPDPALPGALVTGSEPVRLFRSLDAGRSWRELTGITQIGGHERWFLPYSPRAGALRNIYTPPGCSSLLLAAVEVGGLLRSEDGGETWTCAPVIEDEDIHFITGHPDVPDLLYAALGYASLSHPERSREGRRFGGVARSHDGGRTWEKIEHDYTRAVIVPPSRPDLLLAGPAPHVGRDGRIVVSPDDGDTWRAASDGIETPMPDMVEVFVVAPDDTIWAIRSGGGLLRATPGDWTWHSPLPPSADLSVQSVAFVA